LQRQAPANPEPPRTDLPDYERNLRSIAAVARAAGARVILMTQASTWAGPDARARQWSWMRLRRDGTYSEQQMDEALERYNDVMRSLAAEGQGQLLDLAAAVPKTLDYFYDDVHFNTRGAREGARLLAAVISPS